MPNFEKEELFERTPVPVAIAQLSVPTVLSSLVMVIYSLADTYFIGILNDPIQNAAVTLAAPLLLAFNAINNLFGIGSSSMMSRALGAKNYKLVSQSSAFGFYGALLFSVLFSLTSLIFQKPLLSLLGADSTTAMATLSYMRWTVFFGAVPSILNVVLSFIIRAEGYSAQSSIGSIAGCVLNIILDPLFVLPQGLNMGVAGVALATFLSNLMSCLYFLFFLYKHRKTLYASIRPRDLSLNKRVVGGVFSVGLSAAIQNLLNVTSMMVLNNFTASYGTNAIAAMGITQKINLVPVYILSGITQGVSPLISYTYANHNRSRMKRTIFFSSGIVIGFSAISLILFLCAARPITALFMKNTEVVSIGARLLQGFCLGLPFLCMDFMAVGVFQATGMGRQALSFAIMRKVILEIPALFILNYFFRLYGLAYAQMSAEIVLAIAAVIMLVRLLRRPDTL